MIRLDRTVRKLGIVLGGAVATNQLNVIVSGVERIPSAAAQLAPIIGFTQIATTNGATDVDICAAPKVNGHVREIESIYFRNRDTAAVTASIEYDDNGTDYIIFTATLAVGDFVSYSYRSGWQVFDTNGNAKASSSFTIGATLVGGTATRILFTGTGPILTDDADFTYNSTTNVLTVGELALTTDLSVANGGTGASTLADGGLVVGNAASAVEVVAAGATTEILVGGGAATNPVWTTATGSGAPVRATSPTLVTPVIGAATGTSLSVSGALTTTAGVLTASGTGTHTIAGLVDISGASAGQIKFPATQNASSEPNTFDDYEEGTWTPTDQSGASLVFTSVGGSYEKIARQVRASMNADYPSTADGSAAVIGGLPFGVASGTNNEGRQGFMGTTTESTAARVFPTGSGLTTFDIRTTTAAQVTNATMSTDTMRATCLYYV